MNFVPDRAMEYSIGLGCALGTSCGVALHKIAIGVLLGTVGGVLFGAIASRQGNGSKLCEPPQESHNLRLHEAARSTHSETKDRDVRPGTTVRE